MRRRIAGAVALAGIVAAGAVYAASAFGSGHLERCQDVRVSFADVNGLTGGVGVDAVTVKNLGKRDCAIEGRPWVRLGPLRYPVTVAEARPGEFGSAGDPARSWVLHPGQHISAAMFVVPGSCDRAVWHVFGAPARVGWADRSVATSVGGCKNGTAEVVLGSFQHR